MKVAFKLQILMMKETKKEDGSVEISDSNDDRTNQYEIKNWNILFGC
jgi:hypothetical protein